MNEVLSSEGDSHIGLARTQRAYRVARCRAKLNYVAREPVVLRLADARPTRR